MTENALSPFRSLDLLRYEERIALWTLRELLKSETKQKSRALVCFLGKEVPALQKYFQSVLLQSNHHIMECELSPAEIYMLKLMAYMQNAVSEEQPMSTLKNALMHLSFALAAYGCWLPFSESDLFFLAQKSYMPVEQDNYSILMQAAE